MKYLAYFQAYTNTYGELQELKNKYLEALQNRRCSGTCYWYTARLHAR